MIRRLRQLGNVRFLNREIAGVHAAALILGAAGLASRILGVVRDRLLAAHFGAGRELDIYNAAFNLPDFMATLFLLGGATAAILPVFQGYRDRDRERARRLMGSLETLFLLGSAAMCAGAFAAAPLMMRWVVPGFPPEDRAMTAFLTRVMLVSPILLGISGIFSVVVQSYKRFFVYAAAPIVYNLGIIFGIVALAPRMGIAGVAAGVVTGAGAHMVLQAVSAATLGFFPDIIPTLAHFTHRMRQLGGDIRGIVLVGGPRVLAVSLAQLTLVALDAMGSLLAPGSVAVLGFAQNLYFVPVGIFGVSYATAIFPRLAAAACNHKGAEFAGDLSGGIRSVLFWVAPVAALTIVLRAHVVRAALGAGVFSWDNTRLTAAVLAALALAMAAGAVQILLIRAFYALGNTWIPLAVNAVGSLIAVASAFFFVHALAGSTPLGGAIVMIFRIADLPHPGAVGLGLGFAAGLVTDVVALAVLLKYYVRVSLGATLPPIALAVAKIIAAAVCAGAVAYVVRAQFSDALPLITFVRVVIEGMTAAVAGFVVYFGILAIMGSEDMALLRRAAARRLFSLRILPAYWDGDGVK